MYVLIKELRVTQRRIQVLSKVRLLHRHHVHHKQAHEERINAT